MAELLYKINNNDISFDGIAFPVVKLSTDFKPQFVAHPLINTDGDFMQYVGGGSLVISMEAIFDNTLIPSKDEKWIRGQLYPNTYMLLNRALSQGKVGVLTHPFLGRIDCVCTAYSAVLDSARLSSPTVSLTFTQTVDVADFEQVSFDKDIKNSDKIFNEHALEIAEYMSKAQYKAMIAENRSKFNSLSNALNNIIITTRKISGAVAMASYRAANIVGLYDTLAYHLKSAASDIQAIDNVLLEKMKRTITKMRSDVNSIRQSNINNSPSVREYTLEYDMSPAILTQLTSNNIQTLLALNGGKIVKPLLPKGMKIVYNMMRF